MIQEDYDISVIGKQSQDGESDEITLNTVGSCLRRGDTWFIAYKEYDSYQPDHPKTSVVKVEEGCVTVISKHSRLILEEGRRHLCRYDTDFGTLTMGVFTSSLHADLHEHGGKLGIKYTLEIDSSLTSYNEIHIALRRRRCAP